MTTRRFTRKVAACLPVATVVVCIVIFAWFTFLRCGPTYYSEGYSEGKFLRLREGMTTREVEAIIGRPLEQVRSRVKITYRYHNARGWIS